MSPVDALVRVRLVEQNEIGSSLGSDPDPKEPGKAARRQPLIQHFG